MSIYDKASLVLIPSGTKTSKVYSQKPTNGDGDFTFSRSTAATRVNASGNIEKETQNLLLQSNTFNTTWTNVGLALTSGQSGYDGTSNAWKIEATSAVVRLVQANTTSGVQTFSVYAKAGNVDIIRFQTQNGGTDIFFNVNTGSIVSAPDPKIDATIEAAGNGFYRCTLTYNETLNEIRILPQRSAFSVLIGDYIYIQDAQLEQGLVARDYIETTTTAIYGGITDNVPRLDYTDSSCPALLLEPQRTNILENSEYILGSDWNQLGGALTIAQNTSDTLSPEGKYNAGKITLSTATNRFFSSQGYSIGGPTNASVSVWLKSDGADIEGALAFFNGSGGDAITITNEWQRFEINKAVSKSTEYIGLDFRGAGYSTSGNVYCYGWQFENNSSYATSYIPTYGSAVTRNNDYMRLLASNFYSTTSYTYFLDIDLPYDVGTSSALWKDNDNLSSNGGFQLRKTSPTGSYVGITTHNGSSFTGFFTNVLTGRLKLAIIYNNGQVSVYYNGVQSGSAISVTGWNQSTNHFKFEDGSSGAYETNQFLYLPTALTDQEAIDLTTI